MDSTVSSWKTNLLLSSRTPSHFWVLALLLTLILHFLIIWLLSDWLSQKPKKPQFLRVEWLPPPQKPVLKKTKAQIPIPVPEETEEPDKLNDLIQKEPAEKLSMKMLKTAKKNPDSEKLSAYECGFEAFSDSRMEFDVRFYLVAILFIIFDLEIAFLFPWAISLGNLGALGFWSMMIFLFILTIGFIYEWKKGALDWD